MSDKSAKDSRFEFVGKRSMTEIDAWFAEMDRFADVPFMEEGRDQPLMPPDWLMPNLEGRGKRSSKKEEPPFRG